MMMKNPFANMGKLVKDLKKRLGIGSKRVGHKGIQYFDKVDGLHISSHTGKLADMHSLSTSCLDNPNCEKRRKIPGSICEVCFSVKTQEQYSSLEKQLIKNGKILRSHLLSDDELPLLNDIISRVESFGDVSFGEEGIIQARNYIRYVKHNPLTTFGWWSKNLGIIHTALKLEGYDADKGEKPGNVVFIVSALYKNKAWGIKNWKRVFPWVDKEFVVLSPEFVVENPEYESLINCGARQCMACRICYSNNDVTTIYELEK